MGSKGYRSTESHFSKDPEKRARQLANLELRNAKRRTGIQTAIEQGLSAPFDPKYKDDPVRFIEEQFYLTPERKLIVLDEWQKQLLKEIFERDPVTGVRRYNMAVISTPKKCGKTSLAAAIVDYFLFQEEAEGEIILAANSAEQSTYVVYKKLCKSIRMNRYQLDDVKILDDSIENLKNGTVVRVVAQNARTIAGLNPNLVLFDELHSYRDTDSNNAREFFNELSLSPTRKEPLTLITSYAGTDEDSLLHDIYLKGLEGSDPRLCFFWSHDPLLSPRTKPEDLEDRRRKLHPNAYARLWENRWTQGEKEFVSLADYDKCVDPTHAPMFEDFHKENRVYLGIDIGVKSDCSAVVAVAKQGEKVALIQHRIWRPRPNDPVDIRDIENYILDLSYKFHIVEAHFDPSQFLEGERRLTDAGINMVQFTQSQGVLIEMAQNLYQLFRSGTLRLYKADDLRAHMQHTSIKESARGFQIIKDAPSKKIDGVIALAMCCLAITKSDSGGGEVYISERSVYPDDSGPVDILSGDFLR